MAELLAGVTVKVPVVLILVPIVLAALAVLTNTKEKTTRKKTMRNFFICLIIKCGIGKSNKKLWITL